MSDKVKINVDTTRDVVQVLVANSFPNGSITNAQLATVATSTIKGRVTAGTGAVEDLTPTQAKSVLSLGNVDNTSDANKPVSTATQTAINAGDANFVTVANEAARKNPASYTAAQLSVGTTTVIQSDTPDYLYTRIGSDVTLDASWKITVILDSANDAFFPSNIVASGGITATLDLSGANLSGTNTGDQTSIVGITGTLAQFNTAVTDANLASLTGSETLTNKSLTAPTLTGSTTLTGGSLASTSNALSITGTMSSANAAQQGIRAIITASGTAAQVQDGAYITLAAGYTGSNYTIGTRVENLSAGTGVSASSGGAANYGLYNQCYGTTTGHNVGLMGLGQNSSVRNFGVIGLTNTTGANNIAVLGNGLTGTNKIGVYGTLTSTLVTGVTAALIADNGTVAAPILIAYDNSIAVFVIGDGGDIAMLKTITSGGTTGARTINQPSGSVNFAAAATSLVVTNSLCTANSIIHCTIATNDATANGIRVVAGAGSFTIHMITAPTAETRVNFLLTN